MTDWKTRAMRRNSLEAVLTTHCVEYEDTVTVEEAEARIAVLEEWTVLNCQLLTHEEGEKPPTCIDMNGVCWANCPLYKPPGGDERRL